VVLFLPPLEFNLDLMCPIRRNSILWPLRPNLNHCFRYKEYLCLLLMLWITWWTTRWVWLFRFHLCLVIFRFWSFINDWRNYTNNRHVIHFNLWWLWSVLISCVSSRFSDLAPRRPWFLFRDNLCLYRGLKLSSNYIFSLIACCFKLFSSIIWMTSQNLF